MNRSPWSTDLDALFVGPHPDDAELFCGGTIALMAQRGSRVGVADLTRGELGTNGDVETRRRESLEAAERLSVTPPRHVLGLPDGGLSEADPAQVTAMVELIRAARPRLLFVPALVDRHPDHEGAGRLARRAVFLSGLRRYEASGEPHRPAALVHYVGGRDLEPTFLVDVTTVMEQRRQALKAYRSQFEGGAEQHPTVLNTGGFLGALEARMRAWGARAGAGFAEGYVLESIPLVKDPLAWLDPREQQR